MTYFEALAVLLGALGTYECSRVKGIGAIRASAGLTLLFYCVLLTLREGGVELELHRLAGLFFGASFLGMSSQLRIKRFEIILGSFIFLLYFDFVLPFCGGLGGALGLGAFLSLVKADLICVGIKRVYKAFI